MNISIDYDDTYTKDPELWDQFISMAQSKGHQVFCITKRYEEIAEDIKSTMKIQTLFATQSKLDEAHKNGVVIDIWIDDKPQSIYPYRLLQPKTRRITNHVKKHYR